MTRTSYSGVTALVLGASGFIGRWVVRALVDEQAIVHAVVRDWQAVRRTGVAADHCAVLDLTDAEAVSRIVTSVRPDVIFNLAGYGVDHAERDPLLMDLVNTRAVQHVCDAASALPPTAWPGLRLVHAGSALEYGRAQGALHEDVAPEPDSEYGRTKLAGTEVVRDASGRLGLAGAVARLFTVYGPGEQPGRLLPSLLGAARSHGTLPLSAGTQCRDFTYLEDVADGLLRLGASRVSPGSIVNLATGRLTSVRTFAETAAEILGIDRPRLGFGAIPGRADEMFHGPVDVTRLQQVTGWKPETTVAEGIRRTWEHVRVD